MTPEPLFTEIFDVMSAASVGDATRRVRIPSRVGGKADCDHWPTQIALALNILLDDLALRVAEAEASRDLAERRRLHDDQLRLSAIVESSSDGIIAQSLDGIITSWNRGAERLFGYSPAEAIGRPMTILAPPSQGREELTTLERLCKGETLDHFETVRRCKDGHEIDISVTFSPIHSFSGEIVGVSKVARDISDRKRVEAALLVANEELRSFGYSVAHDLRAPLRRMRDFARILVRGHRNRLDADGQSCLQEIDDGAVQMASLIDALLSLSRVTQGSHTPQWIDMSAVARRVAERLAAAEPGRAVEVVIEDAVFGFIDPQLCWNLLENLLGNAWKFTSKTAAARIEFGAAAGDLVPSFFVRDNGAGFDMRYASKLFSPFQRLHSSADFQGIGIGLATARRIVHHHGGRIWAESAIGQGAEFRFTLASTPIGGNAP